MTAFGGLLVGIRREQGRLAELAPLIDSVDSGMPAWRAAVVAVRASAGDTTGARAALEPLVVDGAAGLVEDQLATGVIAYVSESAADLMRPDEARALLDRIHPFVEMYSIIGTYSIGPLGHAAALLLERLGRSADARSLSAEADRQWSSFRADLRAAMAT